MHRLFHFFDALQNFTRFGFSFSRYANGPPTENISALLAGRGILVHTEERYSGFLQQALRQTDRDRALTAGSDQDVEINFAWWIMCVC